MGANYNRPPDSCCAFEPCVRGELNQPGAVGPNHIRTRASACRSEAKGAAPRALKSHCLHGELEHRHPTVRRGDGGDPGTFALYGESNTRKGDSMAKIAAGGGGTDSSVADQLRGLGVRGVLVRMAERGQLLALRCEMPQCYHHKGAARSIWSRRRALSGRPRPTTIRSLSRPAGTSSPKTFGCPTSGVTTGTMDGGRRSGRCSRKASPSPTSPRL